MSDDEWNYLTGTWNVFENDCGWRITLDVSRLPGNWPIERRKEYAAALLYALNNGQPAEGAALNIAGTGISIGATTPTEETT